MAVDNGCPDFNCDLTPFSIHEQTWRGVVLTLLQRMQSSVQSAAGLSPIVAESTYPKVVAVADGGTGTTVIPANADRRPGSYIQNISDTPLEFTYGTSITSGQAGILNPGGVLDLSQNGNVYTGAIRMYQNSGATKNVYVASFVAANSADLNTPIEVEPESTYPKIVTITTAGSGIEVLDANALRGPGSYIQNISDTPIEYTYGATITSGQAGILNPGGVLDLSSSGGVYKGKVMMYQASGASKNVYVVSLVEA